MTEPIPTMPAPTAAAVLRLLPGGRGDHDRGASAVAEGPGGAATPDHDLAVLARAQRGDARAFALLVRPHLPLLLRVGARAAWSKALGEDAVQEALVIAARDLQRFRPGSSLRAWLASIVTTRAFTLMRAEGRRRERDAASDGPLAPPGPAEAAQARQAAAKVQELLQRMPEKRRMAALLRLDGGMEYGEIAEAIGSTEDSARALVHLAVKALRDGMREEAP